MPCIKEEKDVCFISKYVNGYFLSNVFTSNLVHNLINRHRLESTGNCELLAACTLVENSNQIFDTPGYRSKFPVSPSEILVRRNERSIRVVEFLQSERFN